MRKLSRIPGGLGYLVTLAIETDYQRRHGKSIEEGIAWHDILLDVLGLIDEVVSSLDERRGGEPSLRSVMIGKRT